MPHIQVNDINIFYRVFCNDIEVITINPLLKTMIIVHGAPGLVDHQIELEAWRDFSKTVQTIFLDMRGCGQTEDGPLEKWSLQQCADDIYAFCQKLKIEKPIMAGVSAGGYTLILYAITYPQSLKALILCNTEARVSKKERLKAFQKLTSSEAVHALENFHADPINNAKAQDFFEKCLPYFSKKKFSLVSAAKTNWDVWSKFAGAFLDFDHRESLRKSIQYPVLILAGEDDPAHPIACAIETANHIPKQFLHFDPIKDAGAPVYQDQPKIFREKVNAFLKALG